MRYCVLKLYVNHNFMVQKRVRMAEMTITIEKWKTRYALRNHNYEIYAHVESRFTHTS